jgi:hypothetical protein
MVYKSSLKLSYSHLAGERAPAPKKVDANTFTAIPSTIAALVSLCSTGSRQSGQRAAGASSGLWECAQGMDSGGVGAWCVKGSQGFSALQAVPSLDQSGCPAGCCVHTRLSDPYLVSISTAPSTRPAIWTITVSLL